MRKTTKQILKEIRLDEKIALFPERIKLIQSIDDVLSYRKNELEALLTAQELVKDTPILSQMFEGKMAEHLRSIIKQLGLTIEGFKTMIEQLEEQHNEYTKRRNDTKQRMDKRLDQNGKQTQ